MTVESCGDGGAYSGPSRPGPPKTLTAIHFFRYFATTLLIAGLVSRKLPSGFADPAAFGDLLVA
jgi:hypothetical protein